LNSRSSFYLLDNEATRPRSTQKESQMETNIGSLVEGFVRQIVAAVEADSVRRVQQAVGAAFAGGVATVARRPGRPAAAAPASAPVRRRPKQFCPVPGCTGVAAPVFGMVCTKHKDLPKTKIAEYRAQRHAAKK
jgi:mRNA degradation ribonuclease J1/J2